MLVRRSAAAVLAGDSKIGALEKRMSKMRLKKDGADDEDDDNAFVFGGSKRMSKMRCPCVKLLLLVDFVSFEFLFLQFIRLKKDLDSDPFHEAAKRMSKMRLKKDYADTEEEGFFEKRMSKMRLKKSEQEQGGEWEKRTHFGPLLWRVTDAIDPLAWQNTAARPPSLHFKFCAPRVPCQT